MPRCRYVLQVRAPRESTSTGIYPAALFQRQATDSRPEERFRLSSRQNHRTTVSTDANGYTRSIPGGKLRHTERRHAGDADQSRTGIGESHRSPEKRHSAPQRTRNPTTRCTGTVNRRSVRLLSQKTRRPDPRLANDQHQRRFSRHRQQQQHPPIPSQQTVSAAKTRGTRPRTQASVLEGGRQR